MNLKEGLFGRLLLLGTSCASWGDNQGSTTTPRPRARGAWDMMKKSDTCSWAQWRYNSDLQTCAERWSPGLLRAECARAFRERYRQELTQGDCPTRP
jgi:hypothetical protein